MRIVEQSVRLRRLVLRARVRSQHDRSRAAAFLSRGTQDRAQPVVANLARLGSRAGQARDAIVGTHAAGIARVLIRRRRGLELQLRRAIAHHPVQLVEVLAVLGEIHVAKAGAGGGLLGTRKRHGGREYDPCNLCQPPAIRRRTHRSPKVSGGVTGGKPRGPSAGGELEGGCASPRIPADPLCGCGCVSPACCIIHSMS